jgi:hypothetical protein
MDKGMYKGGGTFPGFFDIEVPEGDDAKVLGGEKTD